MIELNVEFQERYKRLDALCRDLFSSKDGVTRYIQEMENTPYQYRKLILNWDSIYKQLKHLRHLRNQLAHEVGALTSELCTESDINRLTDFYNSILNTTDPLAKVGKAERAAERADKEIKKPQPSVIKTYDYKFTFNPSALLLFALVMLPNIIWFLIPASNDILRNPSDTPILDTFASIMQVILVIALLLIKNKRARKLKTTPLIILCVAFCLLYYICWILYYCDIVNSGVLLCLCLFPCLSFLFYGFDRKNYIALLPIAIFTLLHFLSTVINFI